MEKNEILGFHFESAKTLQPDSSSDENWETCSTADSESNITRQNVASVDTWCMCFNCSQMSTTKECLCCHELDACEYFKIKGLCIYLRTILQIFFIKLISNTLCYELNHSCKKRKVFRFVMTIFKSVSLLHIA